MENGGEVTEIAAIWVRDGSQLSGSRQAVESHRLARRRLDGRWLMGLCLEGAVERRQPAPSSSSWRGRSCQRNENYDVGHVEQAARCRTSA